MEVVEEKEVEEPIETDVEDFSDWEQATSRDLDVLRIPQEPEKVIVPIDYENKKYIVLYIRELTIDDQLRLLEQFFTFDSKTSEAKLKWLPYYRTVYTQMVKRSEPPISWKEARLLGKKFLSVLMRYLPHPFEIGAQGPGGVSEFEEKNSERP